MTDPRVWWAYFYLRKAAGEGWNDSDYDSAYEVALEAIEKVYGEYNHKRFPPKPPAQDGA